MTSRDNTIINIISCPNAGALYTPLPEAKNEYYGIGYDRGSFNYENSDEKTKEIVKPIPTPSDYNTPDGERSLIGLLNAKCGGKLTLGHGENGMQRAKIGGLNCQGKLLPISDRIVETAIGEAGAGAFVTTGGETVNFTPAGIKLVSELLVICRDGAQDGVRRAYEHYHANKPDGSPVEVSRLNVGYAFLGVFAVSHRSDLAAAESEAAEIGARAVYIENSVWAKFQKWMSYLLKEPGFTSGSTLGAFSVFTFLTGRRITEWQDMSSDVSTWLREDFRALGNRGMIRLTGDAEIDDFMAAAIIDLICGAAGFTYYIVMCYDDFDAVERKSSNWNEFIVPDYNVFSTNDGRGYHYRPNPAAIAPVTAYMKWLMSYATNN